jgi:hypothetical protein
MYDIRPIHISPAMYAKWILNQKNSVARRDISFLFYLVNNKEIRAVDSGIYSSLHSSKLPNLTAGKLKEKIENNDLKLEANLSTVFTSLTGSRQYWSRKFGDLEIMDEKFGPATFFLTLSCAEYYWDEMHRFLIEMNQDIPNVANLKISSLVSLDPVMVSKLFNIRWKNFFNNVIKNKNGPLGEVEHYFWRLEYQARGMPHIHMKLWVKNAPIINQNTEEEVIAFIDKHITCSIPNDNDELKNLVQKFQFHKCTNSCKRQISTKQKDKKNEFVKCRYGYPRKVFS